METISLVLLLLAAVVASSFMARAAPIPLPLPLVQVVLGAMIAWSGNFHVALDPDIFLLLFIAPLLFLDGWRVPKQGLLRDRWTIFALAFGLVVFTVVGAGLFIHWLIPAMPLAVAFALAAVLSPTDAVAVSAIAARTPLPRRLAQILEGESLLNDASGLVCMRFAVAAALTGSFSLVAAAGTFIWLALGGAAVGLVVTLLANLAKDWISRQYGEEPGTQILISLLIPFAVYLSAEHLGASGILAVVAAGIVMSYEEQSGRALAITRVRRTVVWDAVEFAGNGVIFVLLGQQLPGIVAGVAEVSREAGHPSQWWLVVDVLALCGVLAALRCIWAWTTLGLILFRSARAPQRIDTPSWRLVAVTALAGVRGAVTLSGVMTLPLTLLDGAPFPTRDLAILLAAGVIVVSLVAANAGLPLLMRGVTLPPEPQALRAEDEARAAAAQAAIRAIEQALHGMDREGLDTELCLRAGERVMSPYRARIDARVLAGGDGDLVHKLDRIERRLRLAALGAEREEVYRFARSGRLTDEIVRVLVREVDLQETRLSAR